VEGRPSSSRRRRSMRLIAVAIVLGVPSGCAAGQAGTPTPGPSSPGAPATTSELARDGGIDPGTKFSPVFVSTLAALHNHRELSGDNGHSRSEPVPDHAAEEIAG